MRLVMFVRISRCPENQSSYLPFEENHAQTKCANLTTESVFNQAMSFERTFIIERVHNALQKHNYNAKEVDYTSIHALTPRFNNRNIQINYLRLF